jgi:hypothetical protein
MTSAAKTTGAAIVTRTKSGRNLEIGSRICFACLDLVLGGRPDREVKLDSSRKFPSLQVRSALRAPRWRPLDSLLAKPSSTPSSSQRRARISESLVKSKASTHRSTRPTSRPCRPHKSACLQGRNEFGSRAKDAWAYQFGVQLDFIRPGKPVENSYIESFNGRRAMNA